jgi:hypothetical protein
MPMPFAFPVESTLDQLEQFFSLLWQSLSLPASAIRAGPVNAWMDLIAKGCASASILAPYLQVPAILELRRGSHENKLSLSLLTAFLLLASPLAKADTTCTYTGNPLGYPYTSGGGYVTASITLSAPLGDDFNGWVNPVAWSLADSVFGQCNHAEPGDTKIIDLRGRRKPVSWASARST